MVKLAPAMNRAAKGRALSGEKKTRPAIGTEVSKIGRQMKVGFMSAAHARLINPRMAQFAGLTA
jgi:hypothetical protein